MHNEIAPLALRFEQVLSPELLQEAWRRELGEGGLPLQALIEADLDQLFTRYIAVAEGWCPRQ